MSLQRRSGLLVQLAKTRWSKSAGMTVRRAPRLSLGGASLGKFRMSTRCFMTSPPRRVGEEAPASTGTTPTYPRWMPNFMKKDHIVAGPGFNRWLVPPASISVHLCIGSVYAWSIFNAPLTRQLGVVASASQDWTLADVVPVFSTSIVCLGLAAAVAGKWLEEVGPRMVGSLAACCWGGGFLIGSAGVLLHQLPLLYLGYGVIGGCGLGLGYVSPVSTLIRWFPDRRGMATGMAIMGFGGGAMCAVPVKENLLAHFFRAPDYLGSVHDVSLVTQGGVRMAEVGGQLREVIVASAADLSKLPVQGLSEGVYLVGTGSAGVVETFATLGVLYSTVMLIGSFSYRIPAADWKPQGWTPPAATSTKSASMITTKNVHIDQALKTPQFYLLWTNLCCNVTAGIGVIGVAKTMMTDIFGSALPHIVTGSFAATYVLMISVFNMVGRFVWASASDYLGRKITYGVFFSLGIPLYLSIPYAAQWATQTATVWPLACFYGSTMVIFTMYGGGFATIPAYLADIFGTKYVGGIHGRLLTSWSMAGVLGPVAITYLRKGSVDSAIHTLAQKVDPAAFAERFGAPVTELSALIDSNAVTIARLLEIAPAGTVDPTPDIYNTTMYAMAGVLGVAFVANSLIQPVHPKHWMKEDEANTTQQPTVTVVTTPIPHVAMTK